MTHLWIDEPIIVTVDDDGVPTQFIWQGKRHKVAKILKPPWELEIDWWRAEGGIHRLSLLVFTDRGMVCVIYLNQENGEWRFRRRYD
jgi:hypothetical protein